jgi:hypothetical protein
VLSQEPQRCLGSRSRMALGVTPRSLHWAATLAGKRSAACLRSQETDRLWVCGSACRGLTLWQRGSKLFAGAMNLLKPEATLHLHVSVPPSPSDGSDARTPRGKALLAPPPRDVVAMMGRVRTFRSRANWERSPLRPAVTRPYIWELYWALFVVAEWLSFPQCMSIRR